RRHTRFKCDWSSDVCSSDLVAKVAQNCAPALSNDGNIVYLAVNGSGGFIRHHNYLLGLNSTTLATVDKVELIDPTDSLNSADVRSEERRVGKTGRRRWDPVS